MPISETYNIDCNIGMQGFNDNYFDYAIIDPNWGIKETSVSPESRNTPVKQSNGNMVKIAQKDYSKSKWDDERPTADFFNELFRVSRFQIIKGGNHFTDLLPEFSSGRIIWDKVNGTNDFSDCEIFWTNMFSSTRLFSYMWNGMMQGESLLNPKKQQGNKKLNEKRIHRNQTPVKVYDWVHKNLIPAGSKILDTHLGSGSSRISAYKNGCDFVGYEIDPKSFKDQEKRFEFEKPKLDEYLKFINQTKNNQEVVQGTLL